MYVHVCVCVCMYVPLISNCQFCGPQDTFSDISPEEFDDYDGCLEKLNYDGCDSPAKLEKRFKKFRCQAESSWCGEWSELMVKGR